MEDHDANKPNLAPGDDSEAQALAETSQPATLREEQIVREEQIANAVAFLSHPKVRGSPKPSKVQFLRNKGLTQAEIDEAFIRVPETSLPTTSNDSQSQPSSSGVITTTSQHLQPAPYIAPPPPPMPASTGAAMAQSGNSNPMLLPPYQQQQLPPEQRPVNWSQALLGAGFTAAGAYAVKSLVWPYVSDAYKGWKGDNNPAASSAPEPSSSSLEEQQHQQSGESGGAGLTTPSGQPGQLGEGIETAAAKSVAKAMMEQTIELRTAIASIQELAKGLEGAKGVVTEAEGSAGENLTASELRQELKAFAASLSETTAAGRPSTTSTAPIPPGLETELSQIKFLLTEYLNTPRSGSRTPSEYNTILGGGAHPAGGGNSNGNGNTLPRGALTPGTLVSAVERAANARQLAGHGTGRYSGQSSRSETALPSPEGKEGPSSRSGVRDGMTTALPPPALPAEESFHSVQNEHLGFVDGEERQGSDGMEVNVNVSNGGRESAVLPTPPKPASYMEVLEMLEKGETPPGIRTDINDKPPNPLQPPPPPRMKPLPKPWERSSLSSSSQPISHLQEESTTTEQQEQEGNQAIAAAGTPDSNNNNSPGGAEGTPGSSRPGSSISFNPTYSAEGMSGGMGVSDVESPSGSSYQNTLPSPDCNNPTQIMVDGRPSPSHVPSCPAKSGSMDLKSNQTLTPSRSSIPAPPSTTGSMNKPSPTRAVAIINSAASASSGGVGSIYEAATTSAPDSPSIIAAKFSPRARQVARQRSSDARPAAVAGSGSMATSGCMGGGHIGGYGGSARRSLGLDAGEESTEVSPRIFNSSGNIIGLPDGNGLGRPASRGWKPPPMPTPTVSPTSVRSSLSKIGTPAGTPAGTPGGSDIGKTELEEEEEGVGGSQNEGKERGEEPLVL